MTRHGIVIEDAYSFTRNGFPDHVCVVKAKSQQSYLRLAVCFTFMIVDQITVSYVGREYRQGSNQKQILIMRNL